MGAGRRLIVNADDFGRSHSINQAVLRAHRDGILTSASLMVTGEAVDEAVAIARANPRLGVGLHLTLIAARSVLPASEIPGLVSAVGEFRAGPVATGCAYFFGSRLVPELKKEITAQFEKFIATGLTPDHVNGHLNLHLHPRILPLVLACMSEVGVAAIRTTRDRWAIDWQLNQGQWWYRITHALLFRILGGRAQREARRRQFRFTDSVFGLLRNGRVDEFYVANLIKRLPAGDSELYAHPSLDEGKHELDALISPDVKSLIRETRIRLIRYQDL